MIGWLLIAMLAISWPGSGMMMESRSLLDLRGHRSERCLCQVGVKRVSDLLRCLVELRAERAKVCVLRCFLWLFLFRVPVFLLEYLFLVTDISLFSIFKTWTTVSIYFGQTVVSNKFTIIMEVNIRTGLK